MLKKKSLFLFLLLVLVSSLILSSCVSGRGRRHSYKKRSTIGRIKVAPSKVKLDVNDRVRAWLNYFQGPGRDRFALYLERSGRYEELMKKILEEYGLPEEVFYLALIESGFSHKANSHAGAVGYWQFIRSTGKMYNLRIDDYIDERRDFVKATHAAANFLAHLYQQFGDWHLAFAAYNAGPGKISRAIKMYKTTDFWRLSSGGKRYLKRETKDYVPKYIAAAIIARNPRKFGFNIKYEEPLDYDEVSVKTQTDLEVVTQCARAQYEEIVNLNPKYIHGITPPHERNHIVRVPSRQGKKFLAAFAKLPVHKRVSKQIHVVSDTRYHRVKRGETLSKIAQRYGTTVSKIMSANGIKNPKYLKKGKKLKIPGEKRIVAEEYVASQSAPGSSDRLEVVKPKIKTKRQFIRYRIKRGDTVSGIADKFEVTAADIQEWNGLKGNRIVAGRKLKIYQGIEEPVATSTEAVEAPLAEETATQVPVTKDVTYKIRGGDTLGAIAGKHKTTVVKLKEWNNIKGNYIRAGQNLIVGKTTEYKTVSVPVEKVAVSRAPSPSSSVESSVYKVKKGDSLYGIAKKHGVEVSELKRWNNLESNDIRFGQKLRITAKKVAMDSPVVEQPPGVSDLLALNDAAPVETQTSYIKYEVKSGDTAWSIARRHKVSVNDIKTWNTAKDLHKIHPGDTLRIKVN